MNKSPKVLSGINLTQVRYRRTIAYPSYRTNVFGRKHTKLHKSNLKLAMDQFLGPKNYKGEYYLNKYYYVPQNHQPNYVKPDLERGQSVKVTADSNDDKEAKDSSNFQYKLKVSRQRSLQPFPFNPFCKTNFQISKDLKQKIARDILEVGLSTQEVASKYKLKIPRIEAIVKLYSIEQEWKQNVNLAKMSETMYKMFPLFEPHLNGENLTEIPIPTKTKNSRFLTIAESEPFGPVEAAKVFGLEPAAETLAKLSEQGEHAAHHMQAKSTSKKNGFLAPVLQGEKSLFKFVEAKAGTVGYRYGTCLRDNKKDRKIGYDASGKMVYLL
ncbi:mitochondrial 37S ribosomal protein MRPS35 [Komagataella phaffii GS115]|uniref:37S ribosomal protein S35, mitochondrial n=1 Tax=Komagataella phaffii (strain GS115 / ATCC 20864) TaxID=644223 RepID=C4QYR8_KOMPG|nr:mitochondrial 37S ribosomal protein MRPS35 [Komagataella phaffii GS115]CAY68392.1 hypothetical protein PAS_chr1-4_0688 [Komagataella phaffii GS115]